MNKLRLVIPKGRISENVVRLLEETGIRLQKNDRVYRPLASDPEIEVKIMKPQNIPELIELGRHDAGFTGYDWIVESRARVAEIMDLGFDPVRIIAALPRERREEDLRGRKIVVVSEYENIAREYLDREKYDYVFLRTYGASEAFPPDDADLIVDNTETGQTMEEHNLAPIAQILESSTRFIANRKSLEDPWKQDKIERLKLLMTAVLDARDRVMLEMNVPKDRLEDIVKVLPCMRSPTVAALFGDQGYAVKIAVRKSEIPKLIPFLKKIGATDILEYELKKVMA
jgi:ATP phosphoribosyltransferase